MPSHSGRVILLSTVSFLVYSGMTSSQREEYENHGHAYFLDDD